MRPKKGGRYEVVDQYTKDAHQKGFVARSIFKLEEIDRRIKLFEPEQRVLDLGSSPGSWLQYSSQRVGQSGLIVGLDIVDVKVTSPNVKFFIQDISDVRESVAVVKEFGPFDIVQSDAMVKTSGIVESDCAKSIQLVESGIAIAKSVLKPGGKFLAKIFEGPGFNEFWSEFRKTFKASKVYRPEAVRAASREIYIYGILS